MKKYAYHHSSALVAGIIVLSTLTACMSGGQQRLGMNNGLNEASSSSLADVDSKQADVQSNVDRLLKKKDSLRSSLQQGGICALEAAILELDIKAASQATFSGSDVKKTSREMLEILILLMKEINTDKKYDGKLRLKYCELVVRRFLGMYKYTDGSEESQVKESMRGLFLKIADQCLSRTIIVLKTILLDKASGDLRSQAPSILASLVESRYCVHIPTRWLISKLGAQHTPLEMRRRALIGHSTWQIGPCIRHILDMMIPILEKENNEESLQAVQSALKIIKKYETRALMESWPTGCTMH